MAEYDPLAVISAARLARSQGLLDGDQYQQIHNQAAADQWSQRVAEMRGAANAQAADPFATLETRYGARQTALGDAARNAANQRFMDITSGNIQATFRGSRMAKDPEFQNLYRTNPQQADAAYRRVYGQSIAEAMMGDQMGGNMSVADIRRRQAMPDMQKAIFERMRGIEGAFGADPMDLIAPLREEQDPEGKTVKYGYDPQTQTAYVPGKMRSDGMGGFVQEPAKSVYVGPMYQQLLNDRAMMAGFNSDTDYQSKQRELQMLLAKKASETAASKSQNIGALRQMDNNAAMERVASENAARAKAEAEYARVRNAERRAPIVTGLLLPNLFR